MSPVEALKIALTKENNSINLYNDLMNKYPEVKELAILLLNEEEKHKKMIEDKIAELTKY